MGSVLHEPAARKEVPDSLALEGDLGEEFAGGADQQSVLAPFLLEATGVPGCFSHTLAEEIAASSRGCGTWSLTEHLTEH